MSEPDDRLESWKKIAAYLRRDVRTVQRWEQSHGLPVHRLSRAQRPIPYAFKGEIDAWWAQHSELGPVSAPARAALPRWWIGAMALAIVATVSGFWLWQTRAVPAASPRSVAVIPFVDLSEGMANEEFADGITEELIDRLNRLPGLRAPAPTSTFYYKNKQVPVAEIAQALRVTYVLDGSVRKTGEQVRIAARLIRAADASVVWSESYDRPWNGMLAVQDDIAGKVSAAIEQSIATRTSP